MRIQKVPSENLCIRRRHHGLTVKERLDGKLQLDAATMAMIYYLKVRIESENGSYEQWQRPLQN
jgi:hypothetical protein